MGKFFNGKVKKDRTSLIKYCVIGLGILIIIILLCAIGCRKTDDFTDLLTLKEDGVTIQINEPIPEATEFFETIDDYLYVDYLEVDYDEDKCDTSKIGECDITIHGTSIDDFETKLYIIDSEGPELTLTDRVEIEVNEAYSPEDFVDYCEDKSGDECTYEFVTGVQDENGNNIDFSAYKNNGTYTIQIIAKDSQGNKSEVQKSTLIIGTGDDGDLTCSYGDLSVSAARVKFPVAVIVGDEEKNCAIDRELWNSATTQASANEMYQEDYTRLQDQMETVLKTNYPNGANIKVYPSYISVLNDSLTGLVGYGIYVKVYIAEQGKQIDLDENLVMAYYLDETASRVYTTNKFNVEK